MRQFASLRFWDEYFEVARERIIHAVTSYMKRWDTLVRA